MSEQHVAWENEMINVATLESRVRALEAWQEKQNGSIQRIERKVDKLMFIHYTELAAIISGSIGVIFAIIKMMR